jgi:hypothetical protein
MDSNKIHTPYNGRLEGTRGDVANDDNEVKDDDSDS